MSKRVIAVMLLLSTAALSACGSDPETTPGPTDDNGNTNTGNDNNSSIDDNNTDDNRNEDDDDTAPVPVSTFSSIDSVILQPRCGSCHGGSGGLSISYDNLVSQPSDACPGLDFVDPGNPDSSALILKLEGDPDCSGSQMPKSGAKLTAEQIAPIRQWIGAGAPNN